MQAADRTADALAGTANVTIDRTSHQTDPAEEIADALRNFDADEIVVVTSRDEQATWLEDETVRAAMDRTGLPVRRHPATGVARQHPSAVHTALSRVG